VNPEAAVPTSAAGAARPVRDFDVSVPHSARIWNYWLGGKDNFQVDRDAGDEFLLVYPEQRDKARACRRFLARAVTHLARECGVRQFLDVGTGLPTAENTHEVAQRVAPESRIVYVDNDPLVLAHARALLTSSPQGVTSYVDVDLRDPEAVLAEAAHTLDLDRPVALLMLGVLGHLEDHDQARAIVARLLAGLPSGSYLVGCDGTISPAYLRAMERYEGTGGVTYHARTPEQLAAFYEGLDVLEPGIVPIHRWKPEAHDVGRLRAVDETGGIGRKP
jgi:O-methyltransferase involved in polyketide biosynthesis